jgi:hypothetical protein
MNSIKFHSKKMLGKIKAYILESISVKEALLADEKILEQV